MLWWEFALFFITFVGLYYYFNVKYMEKSIAMADKRLQKFAEMDQMQCLYEKKIELLKSQVKILEEKISYITVKEVRKIQQPMKKKVD